MFEFCICRKFSHTTYILINYRHYKYIHFHMYINHDQNINTECF